LKQKIINYILSIFKKEKQEIKEEVIKGENKILVEKIENKKELTTDDKVLLAEYYINYSHHTDFCNKDYRDEYKDIEKEIEILKKQNKIVIARAEKMLECINNKDLKELFGSKKRVKKDIINEILEKNSDEEIILKIGKDNIRYELSEDYKNILQNLKEKQNEENLKLVDFVIKNVRNENFEAIKNYKIKKIYDIHKFKKEYSYATFFSTDGYNGFSEEKKTEIKYKNYYYLDFNLQDIIGYNKFYKTININDYIENSDKFSDEIRTYIFSVLIDFENREVYKEKIIENKNFEILYPERFVEFIRTKLSNILLKKDPHIKITGVYKENCDLHYNKKALSKDKINQELFCTCEYEYDVK